MRKQYNSAPLPFVGQKRMFAKEFKKVLEQFPDGTTFVDLFGGSGLLSHIAKCQKPNSKVVYNDFDGYRLRLDHIPQTNELLAELRKIVHGIPRHKPITGEARERVFECLKFVYFTSNKSSILELCDWIGRNKTVGNPFEKCTKVEFNAHMNYNATYTDMMLYKKAG